jgi:RND superfamily putative drug exporter
MTLADRYGRLVAEARWPILALWLAAAILTTVALPNLQEAQTGALGDLVPNDADAIEAEVRATEQFAFPLLSRTVVVQRAPGGLPPEALAGVARRAIGLNRHAYPGLERIGGALPLANRTTALTYLLYGPDVGRNDRVALARRFADRFVNDPEDHLVGITGAIPARAEQADLITGALPLVEMGTVLLVALLVGVHFRAPLAPLACLLAIAVAYTMSIHVVAAIGQALEISVPSEVQPVIVVLLFGIVTDYAVFFLSRFRALLAEARPSRDAAATTVGELGAIILTAGLTVAAGSAALVVAKLGFFQAFGPGMAMAVLLGLVVSLTLVPALLAIGGQALFWPSRPGRDVPAEAAAEETPDEEAERPLRSRVLRVASRRPAVVVVVVGGLLLAAASGLARIEVGQTLIRGLPESSPPRQAYFAAARGFTPGIISPTVVLVEGRGVARERARLVALQRRLERLPGVAEVIGPRQQPTQRNLGAVYSRSADAVRYLLVFDADPLGAAAIARLRELRDRLPSLMAASGLGAARASLAGDTALSEETVRKAGEDLGRIAPATLLVVLVILCVFLRALVAPLYLVAASVLALAAALGLTVYVFQDLLGHGELTFYVPFAAAVLLVALGSDYNVFLVGRIWQEARERPLRDAVAVAGARASTAITVAGVVLALSFALLAIVPLRPFRELAFAMAVGLLVDALLVRTLLVPALVALFGSASGWPGHALARRSPGLRRPPAAEPAPR